MAIPSESVVKLPKNYVILGKFFKFLEISFRLLQSRNFSTTLTNISPLIERISKMSFTHRHLAQLKYILPEALVLKKVLRFDQLTRSMKPDIYIIINSKALEPETKGWSVLKFFMTRLTDYYTSHPEGDEIPEGILPEPFNRPTKKHLLKTLNIPSSDCATMTSFRDCKGKLPSDSFHPQAVAVSDLSLKVNSTSSASVDTISHSNMSPTVCTSPAGPNLSCAPVATPIKETYYEEKEEDSLKNIVGMSTPAKLVSTPSPLPLLKRCYSYCPNDSSSSSPKRPSRFRSSKFDPPVKNQETNNEADDVYGGLSSDDDISDILTEDLLQSIREKERMLAERKKEKERIAMEERNPAISQAKRRRFLIANLPKLFNMIHLLLHSMNRSVITRAELVNKILSGHLGIVDKRAVEDQLNLLLELVPEWISEKLASSGHLLVCINKLSDPATVRSQLEEAK